MTARWNKCAFDLLLFVTEGVKEISVGANGTLTNGEQGIWTMKWTQGRRLSAPWSATKCLQQLTAWAMVFTSLKRGGVNNRGRQERQRIVGKRGNKPGEKHEYRVAYWRFKKVCFFSVVFCVLHWSGLEKQQGGVHSEQDQLYLNKDTQWLEARIEKNRIERFCYGKVNPRWKSSCPHGVLSPSKVCRSLSG